MNPVQTSAQPAEPDMFGDAAPPELLHPDDMLVVDGVLSCDAVVRTKLTARGTQPLPVLCLDVRPLNGMERTIHAEQIFSEAARKQAEHIATTLKKGARITLTTTLRDMRTIFPHVESVAVHTTT